MDLSTLQMLPSSMASKSNTAMHATTVTSLQTFQSSTYSNLSSPYFSTSSPSCTSISTSITCSASSSCLDEGTNNFSCTLWSSSSSYNADSPRSSSSSSSPSLLSYDTSSTLSTYASHSSQLSHCSSSTGNLGGFMSSILFFAPSIPQSVGTGELSNIWRCICNKLFPLIIAFLRLTISTISILERLVSRLMPECISRLASPHYRKPLFILYFTILIVFLMRLALGGPVMQIFLLDALDELITSALLLKYQKMRPQDQENSETPVQSLFSGQLNSLNYASLFYESYNILFLLFGFTTMALGLLCNVLPILLPFIIRLIFVRQNMN